MVDLICCGAINWDINLFMAKLPQTGEEVLVSEIQRVSGGTAANVSVAAARILGPGRVAFIGALGDDEIADIQVSILEKEGVEVSGILRIPGEESGQAYITIGADGENEIHTYFGANLGINQDHLDDPDVKKLMEDAKVSVVMDPPMEVAGEFVERSAEYGSKVIWDPGVYADLGLETIGPVLNNVDYFILNHLEYENLLGTSDPVKVGSILGTERRAIKAIIKHGSEGCFLRDNSSETTVHVGAVPLDSLGLSVVNTVGCGDAFIGAFAAAKVIGLDDVESLRRGCAAGSFNATRLETRGGPTAEQLEDMLRKWNNAQ